MMYDELIKELRDCADLYRFANTQPEKTFAEQWLAILVTKAADAIEELVKENESLAADLKDSNERRKKKRKPQWIPVTERLPEEYERVLTCDGKENIHIMSHTKRYEYPFGINPEHPRYFMPKWWMPLPEPPKDGEE